jgi:hypothetical protein
MSSRLSAFAAYWKRVAKSAVEPQELLNWLIALLAGLAGWLEHWATAPPWLSWAAYSVCGVMVFRGIFWPPFMVHEAQQRAHDDAQKKLAEAHANEIKNLERQLGEIHLPAMTREERLRNTLADFLLLLEARIKEVRKMSPVEYIDSLEDKSQRQGLSLDQLVERINSMLDTVSLEIVARIADFLEKNIGEGQGKLFRSISGIALSPPDRTDDLMAVYANRQKLYLDHLQHWAKNLVEIIKGLG